MSLLNGFKQNPVTKTAKKATQDTRPQTLNAIKAITLEGWGFWCHSVIDRGGTYPRFVNSALRCPTWSSD